MAFGQRPVAVEVPVHNRHEVRTGERPLGRRRREVPDGAVERAMVQRHPGDDDVLGHVQFRYDLTVW